MASNRGKRLSATMREDFDTYRWDGHTAFDAICGMRRSELQGVLTTLLSDAPNTLARALAIECPLDADRQDAIERHVQLRLIDV